jgi:high-affinity iron transporter
VLCLAIGGAIIGTFYRLGRNVWESAEYIYQGVFYLIAAIIISFVGAALLRIGKMQEKWRRRLGDALTAPIQTKDRKSLLTRFAGKYATFALAFITVAREGIEGIVFVAGVSFSAPASSVPLPVIVGLSAGCLAGWILYKSAHLPKNCFFSPSFWEWKSLNWL